MTEYKTEKERILADKSWWLAKLGESIYHQYRMGQLYSEELKEFGGHIQKLDHRLHELEVLSGARNIYCTCGHEVDRADMYCERCGQKLEHVEIDHQDEPCQHCETPLMIGANFCHVCGMRQEEELA
ncbi:hypothetical protein J2R98_002852 [Alkalibacillus filiformis]|uniref:DZANK-type domain-containing protein n=1 Tax=Alkalibacillus filiformis TaxID=200990 RepID=A0ABU0DXK4_9BACI|nr:zinc ribbon domain-containing protein [Alkalibacillus filiformis]MDQ0352991.1 hypothetical protein [Alkalibacillus filiformis]